VSAEFQEERPRLDVRIAQGRITQIGANLLPLLGEATIDASDLWLFPGAVDTRVHLHDPGFTHKENFASGTEAAAAGGVTTVVAQPNTRPSIDSPAVFVMVRSIGMARSRVDFGVAAAVTVDNLSALAELDSLGTASFELALGGPPGPEVFDDPRRLIEAPFALKPRLPAVGVMAADQRLRVAARERIVAAGRHDATAFADAYPPEIEAMAVAVASVASLVSDVPLHFRQIHAKHSLRVLQAFQVAGARIGAEVTPHHLMLGRSTLELLGPDAQMIPPLRPESEQSELIEALVGGVLSTVGSDHAPHADSEKALGHDNLWSSPPGTPGLETLFLALLTLAARGDCSYAHVALWTAQAPSACFGFGDREGRLVVGFDADIALIDPLASAPYDPRSQHGRAKSSPFRGTQLTGAVVGVLSRGRWAY